MAVADQNQSPSELFPPLTHLSTAMLQPPNCLTPLYAQRITGFLNGELDRTALHDHFSTAERHRGSFDLALSRFTDEERRRYNEAAILASAPAENHSETINLAVYASKATLPSMPWIPRPQQFSTSREPNRSRNLRSLHVIPEEEFNRRVLSYIRARPPKSSAKPSQLAELRVPHPDYPSVGNAGVRMPRSEKKVQTWVEQVALQTALCLLKSNEPELEDLDFDEVTGKGMQKALSDVVFERVPTPEERPMALLVEVKCPWTLPYSELIKITELKTGLRPLDQATNSTLRSPPHSPDEVAGFSRQQNETDTAKGKSKRSHGWDFPGDNLYQDNLEEGPVALEGERDEGACRTHLRDPLRSHREIGHTVLEQSFVEAFSGEGDHPILKDPDHKRRARHFGKMRAHNNSTTITCCLLEYFESKSLHDFIKKHSSEEVASTLNRCLPLRIRARLHEMLVDAGLLTEPFCPEKELQDAIDGIDECVDADEVLDLTTNFIKREDKASQSPIPHSMSSGVCPPRASLNLNISHNSVEIDASSPQPLGFPESSSSTNITQLGGPGATVHPGVEPVSSNLLSVSRSKGKRKSSSTVDASGADFKRRKLKAATDAVIGSQEGLNSLLPFDDNFRGEADNDTANAPSSPLESPNLVTNEPGHSGQNNPGMPQDSSSGLQGQQSTSGATTHVPDDDGDVEMADGERPVLNSGLSTFESEVLLQYLCQNPGDIDKVRTFIQLVELDKVDANVLARWKRLKG
ncbi:hypothetical protein FRC00_003205 [Tulasnella sp. 408]|nr:hypothetical protein FRC00_003205 [Tulasnella sp. 408]